jgi:PAS domain S-box-containing protein
MLRGKIMPLSMTETIESSICELLMQDVLRHPTHHEGYGLDSGDVIMQLLKASELRYRRLFETAQDGILILDAKTGMITDVNPFLIDMLGYSREEFIQKKLWEVGAFNDIQASRNAFETLQNNETIRYEDLPLKAKDGRLIQVEFVSNVYLVGEEKVIQCNIRDITEHMRIMLALQVNEKKYHDLVNQSPDGIFIIESSGNILTVNKAMCKELGYSEEEFLFMNIWDIVPEIYLDQYRKRLTKILEGQSLGESAEYTVRGKDGKIHFVEVLSASLQRQRYYWFSRNRS